MLASQKPYVDEQGNVVKKVDDKRKLIIIIISAFILLFAIIIIIISIKNSKNSKCNSLESLINESALAYAKEQEILPTIGEESITINSNELFEKERLNREEFSLNKNNCSGSVTITKVNDGYLTSANLSNCDICSTEIRFTKKSKAVDKIPPKGVSYEVEVKYNYVDKKTNIGEWTQEYNEKTLIEKPFDSVDDKRFAIVPVDSKNKEIEIKSITYYSFRDKKWKFYKADYPYSSFSSTQPAGYSKRDDSTQRSTEKTEWSLTSPEKLSYRYIEEKTGYQWFYYKLDKSKKYWRDGAFSPEKPDDIFIEKDEKNKAKIYRYQDKEWRWYNDKSRVYSSFMSVANSYFPFKDEELVEYGNWSQWNTNSNINASNSYFREEKTEIRKQFRLKYDTYSYNKLENFVSLSSFKDLTGKTVDEISKDPNYAIITQYKYLIRN